MKLAHNSPLLFLIIILSACGIAPIESKVPDQLASFQEQVTPGETSRQEVHERLGQPFFHNERLGIELYRVTSGRDAYVHVAFFPVWVDTEEVIIYALVIYDDGDVVQSINWDVYDVYLHEHYDPNNFSHRKVRMARLEAAGFTFIAIKEGEFFRRKELLLAPASESRDTMHLPPPENKCAILFFYPQIVGQITYMINSEQIGSMPLMGGTVVFGPDLMDVFTKVLVAEGEHEVSLSTFSRPKEFRRKFHCKPGQIFYAHPKLDLVESEPWGFLRHRSKYEGEIIVSHHPLESYEGWRRLLFYSGKWLGED